MLSSLVVPHEECNQQDQDAELVDRRKQVIQSTWRAVQFGLDIKAAEIFYSRLFDQYPNVRDMFPNDMKTQYRKLYNAISLVVQFLDKPSELLPVLFDLGVRHVQYGVVREYYEAVTTCFLWTLNSYIFSLMPNNNAMLWAFDVADAWEWALSLVGGAMGDAADEHLARIRDDEEAREMIPEEV